MARAELAALLSIVQERTDPQNDCSRFPLCSIPLREQLRKDGNHISALVLEVRPLDAFDTLSLALSLLLRP